MPEVLDRAKNFVTSRIPFRGRPEESGQVIFMVLGGEPYTAVNRHAELFDPVYNGIQEVLDLATFGYRNLLRDKYTFHLTAGDCQMLGEARRFIPSAGNTGARMEIYPDYGGQSDTNYGARLVLILPEDEIARRRIKYTGVLITADAVDERQKMGALNPKPPYKEVTVARKTRHENGDPYWGPMQDLLKDSNANPVLAVQQMSTLMRNLGQKYREVESYRQQQMTTEEERALIDELFVKAGGVGAEFEVMAFENNNQLQKLALVFVPSADNPVEPVWRDRSFLADLQATDYFRVPSFSAHSDTKQGNFSVEGVLDIRGNRLPVVIFESGPDYIKRARFHLFRRFLSSRVGLTDELGTPPVRVVSS